MEFNVPAYMRTREHYQSVRKLALEVAKSIIVEGGISYQEIADELDLEFNYVRYLMKILKAEYPYAHQKVRKAQKFRKALSFYRDVKAMSSKEELNEKYTPYQIRHYKSRLKAYDRRMLISLECTIYYNLQ